MSNWSDATVNPAQRNHAHAQWQQVDDQRGNEGVHGTVNEVIQQVTAAARASASDGGYVRVHIRELQIIVIEDLRALPYIQAARLFGN